MIQLTGFELCKIWRKQGFLLATVLLLALNVFFLWYTNLSDGRTPPLSAYRTVWSELRGMTEAEKEDYMEEWKAVIDGVTFVEDVLSMQRMGGGWAEQASQAQAQNPEVFDAYYQQYISGDYLRFTGSLDQERTLVSELYAEQARVASWGEYLQSVQERREALAGISIFAGQADSSFSARNIEKSAADHARLDTGGVHWAPSRAVTSAIENVWTDLLLVLLSFLFVGYLITEEKEKGLFRITRATKFGVDQSAAAKLMALFIHCMASTTAFFTANCLFFGLSAGWCDMSARLQSLAPYMGSSLSLSILGYLAVSVLTKGVVLFSAGAVLMALCILSDSMTVPYLAGSFLWSASWALYRFVPGASSLRAAKYLNLFAILRPKELYGSYLNLDVFGYPVSHVLLSWAVVGAVGILGTVLNFRFFRQECSLTLRRPAQPMVLPFRPHASLFCHEEYKILVTNRALMILFLFTVLIGYSELRHTYTPSVQEQYYQNLMLRLEGERTEEKDRLVAEEAARYEEAFREINAIDAAVASGEMDEETGRSMKAAWYGVTAFYPSFQRVEQQHRAVCEDGRSYLYDTGYLYLLGAQGSDVHTDFLLLTLGTILAFRSVMSMEFETGAWKLLWVSKRGKRGVMTRKWIVCELLAAALAILPLLFRWYSVARAFPIHGLFLDAQSIPYYQNMPLWLPAAGLIALKLALQILSVQLLTSATFILSWWRKNSVQAIFFGLLVLCVPVILDILGFDFAQRFSLYPLYAWALS